MPVGREAERGVVGDVKGAFETWNGQVWVPMDTFEDFHSQKSFFWLYWRHVQLRHGVCLWRGGSLRQMILEVRFVFTILALSESMVNGASSNCQAQSSNSYDFHPH